MSIPKPCNLSGRATYLVAVSQAGAGAPPGRAGAVETRRGMWGRNLGAHRGSPILPADVFGLESRAALHLPEAHGIPRGQGNTATLLITWKARGKEEIGQHEVSAKGKRLSPLMARAIAFFRRRYV